MAKYKFINISDELDLRLFFFDNDVLNVTVRANVMLEDNGGWGELLKDDFILSRIENPTEYAIQMALDYFKGVVATLESMKENSDA